MQFYRSEGSPGNERKSPACSGRDSAELPQLSLSPLVGRGGSAVTQPPTTHEHAMNSAPEYDTSIRGKNCVIFVASVEMLLVTIFFIVTIASYVNNEEKNPDTNLTLVTPLVCLIVFGLIPVGGLFFGGVSETVILCRIWYWINFFCYIGWFGYKCYNIYEGNKPTPKLTLVLEITWSTYRVVSLYIVSAYMQSIKDMKSYLSQ